MKKIVTTLCATALVTGIGVYTADAGKPPSDPPPTGRDVRVFATNDLGMHCVCMGFDTFVLLPPFNTLRAQVIERDHVTTGGTPIVLADPADIRIEYDIVENTEASLDADPYFQSWVTNSPKLFPGFNPKDPVTGNYQGLTGAQLRGEMHAKTSEGWWEIVGVPAYPDLDPAGAMIDPLGGPNRNPYLTGNIKVYDQATDELLAETNTTVPAAFGGCCSCHIDLASDNGYPATPAGSFAYMGVLHEQDNGINIATLDPDGDGTPGPIRCSQCHLDPAMGESTPPGYAGYATSQYTFSDVLHRWHVENSVVLTYNPDLATDCYSCHPGNGINCYRGHHVNKTIGNGQNQHAVWCTDCHGDLYQRVAEGQMLQPWSDTTLPKCAQCHSPQGEGGGYLNMGIFGEFLNSRGHKNDKILCSSCHGAPHGLYPSTLAKDNETAQQYQSQDGPIGVCNVCHVGKSDSYGKPMH